MFNPGWRAALGDALMINKTHLYLPGSESNRSAARPNSEFWPSYCSIQPVFLELPVFEQVREGGTRMGIGRPLKPWAVL